MTTVIIMHVACRLRTAKITLTVNDVIAFFPNQESMMQCLRRSGRPSPTQSRILFGLLLHTVVGNSFSIWRAVLSFQHRLHHRGWVRANGGLYLLGTPGYSATELSSEFRVVAKRPASLVRDPKSGFYRPLRNTYKETPNVKARGLLVWSAFKAAVFGTIDGVAAIPGKLRILANLREPVTSETVVDGYRQVQERVYEPQSGGSPGKRLLQEYEQRGGMARILETDTRIAVDAKPGFSGWFKRVSDELSPMSSRFGTPPAERNQGPFGPFDTLKPVVAKSFVASPEVRDSWQDLVSPNPVRKAIARFRVEEWDRKEKLVEAEIERYRKSRLLKEAVYSIGDAAQNSARYMTELPERLATAIDRISTLLNSVPPVIEKRAKSIGAIRAQVDQKAIEVQKSIGNGIAILQKVTQDVQAIPGRVERTTEAAKESAIALAAALDDVGSQGKVLLGLEKPVPRPPLLPPPPDFPMEEIGWKVAGGLATAAWWVAKGLAVLTWTGTSYAVQKGIEALVVENWHAEGSSPESRATPATSPVERKRPSKSERGLLQSFRFLKPTQEPIAVAPVKNRPAQTDALELESLAIRDDDLDRQVEEALKLAEEALRKEEDISS